nr:rod shape-determining protein MreD [uncultured Sphingosinicella sp.]
MSRIALTSGDVRRKDLRRRYVPIGSVIAACLLNLAPIVVSTPVVPDFAFMVLLAWRLLRPEMWSATTAIPLGLFNDLLVGHPIGQSVALWTTAFLLMDVIDSRVVWRDYWMDWLFASFFILAYTYGDWVIGRWMGSSADFGVLWPLIGASVLVYPVIARIVLVLDRWRLTR